ncbi:leucyl aminopeptidase [Pontibacillus litoralis]|uniref:leucyl aminopeptidase n=1 Tax=Pontibacillus litoralis TaxID=516703 RepID=UPI0005670D93|nr:leucyl aminopeptidase [Pontibacillus litoralis]
MFEIKPTSEMFTQKEAVILAIYEENKQQQPFYSQCNDALDGALDQYIQDGDVSNHYKAVSKVFTLNKIKTKRIYILGLGKKEKLTNQRLKSALGALFKQLQKDKITETSIVLDSFVTDEISAEVVAEVMAEAMVVAPFQFDTYQSGNNKPAIMLESITLLSDQASLPINHAIQKGRAMGYGVNTARQLVQIPGNLLTATDIAEYAKTMAVEYGFEVEFLNKQEMEQLGMGALLAVNQGSVEPPKMIVLKYQGREVWDDVTGLVGKGITFDTGGYSLKPKDGIVGMKGDMGGAAAVLGAMDVIGRLKPKQNVVAVIPSTDNMVSGSAFKPDDVITSMSGKTIEVLNTDAEGRLVLADAITYAKKQYQVSSIIDVATLTGGVVVALGDQVTGAMTNDETLYQAIESASKQAGEHIWQLPYNDLYQEQVRSSSIADLNNSPGRKAHAIMAGAFLAEFADDTSWVHLDIAGTSESEVSYDLGPKGPTGVMVRTLASYVLRK